MAYGTAPAMYVGTDASGGYQVDTVLTRMAFLTPQPKTVLRAFLSMRENLGKNVGDTVYRNRWGNISTAGGAVAESSTIPVDRSMVLSQATATVTEFGNSISAHSKLVDLANIDINSPIVQGLRDDRAKTIDTYLYTNVYDAAVLRYVGTATNGGAFTTNGTATATATSVLNSYHLRQIRKKLSALNAPALPDGFYAGILSLTAADNLRDDADWKNANIYQLPGVENGLITGYMGSLHGFHLFEVNADHWAASGVDPFTNNSSSGAAFFCGATYGTEDLVIPVEVRSNVAIAKLMGKSSDFGRNLQFAWYEAAAFGTLWNVSGTTAHCCKWDSA